MDVVLNNITGLVRQAMDRYRNMPEAMEVPIQLEVRDKWTTASVSSMGAKDVRTHVLPGGRLVSTYTMAELGELAYDSEVSYSLPLQVGEKVEMLDIAVFEQVKDVTRAELECQVCYALFLDPFTTTCGHTFCRKCIRRVRDHSTCCPVCRRNLMISGPNTGVLTSNILLSKLLTGLCHEATAARKELDKEMESHADAELDTPIFVCTLSLPEMPTFLHIFEPRYRLMIRRAIESGDRKFGMVLPNHYHEPQGELGPVPFCQYGTMLEIINMQLLPDGRSLVETVGVSRFRVLKHGFLDDYRVAKVERIDDMSIAAEEEFEIRETSTTAKPKNSSASDPLGAAPRHNLNPEPRGPIRVEELSGLPTQQLFEICVAFVTKMRDESAPWLHSRVFAAYGKCPTDPALFPWWFASVFPASVSARYELLGTSSVRERLKICAEWIARLEASRWYVDNFC